MQKKSDFNLQDYILEHFQYNDDGTITRDDRKGGSGSLDHYGYLVLKIKGIQVKAHQVAWLLNYGKFPTYELDHINRNKTDNRIENLRESYRFEQTNNISRTPNKDTGEIGIYEDRTTKGLKKKFTFRHMGKIYRFYTIQEAKKEKERLKNDYKIDEHTNRIKSSKGAI